MTQGVYNRTPERIAELTKQILAVTPEQLKGVSKCTKLPPSEKVQSLRDARNRYSRTPQGRHQHLTVAARKFKREMHISLEGLENLRKSPCYYCSGPLPLCGHGLDRLDNRLGYTHENVVPCCSRCNRRKGRLEQMGFRYPRTVELMKELMALPYPKD